MRIKEKDEFAFRARFCSENEASGDESVAKARAALRETKSLKRTTKEGLGLLYFSLFS